MSEQEVTQQLLLPDLLFVKEQYITLNSVLNAPLNVLQ